MKTLASNQWKLRNQWPLAKENILLLVSFVTSLSSLYFFFILCCRVQLKLYRISFSLSNFLLIMPFSYNKNYNPTSKTLDHYVNWIFWYREKKKKRKALCNPRLVQAVRRRFLGWSNCGVTGPILARWTSQLLCQFQDTFSPVTSHQGPG